MLTDPAFLIAAIVSVTLVGLAKGGFAGLGALATPVLALAISPVDAAAILLPILIVQDVVSVWAFRHSWNHEIVAWMLPGSLVGVAIGWLFATVLPIAAIMGLVGVITVVFGLWRLWIERGGRIVTPRSAPDWVGTLFGAIAGFTSQIAHAGAPPFQMWVAPKRLPHVEYVGTNSVLFAVINWTKVPAYIALGSFTRTNMVASLVFVPLAIASTLAGVWLVRKMDVTRFYTLIYILMISVGFKLLWDAITSS